MFTANFDQLEVFLLQTLPQKFVEPILLPLGGEIAKESIVKNAAESQNVRGRGFKPLTKDYRLKKIGFVGNGDPNLRLYGDLLDRGLEYVPLTENSAVLTVTDDQLPKAKGLTMRGRAFLIGSQGIANAIKYKGTQALQKFLRG